MKLKTLSMIVISMIAISFKSNAQNPNVNNAGMENWENIGASNVEPTNWNSFMTADGNILTNFGKKQRVNRSTVRRVGTTGLYSAVIWSTNELGTIANGNVTTGKINMGSTSPANAANYNFTKRSDANFNNPFTGHPDSLVFWVRFRPASGGSETARVRAVIHDNYDLHDPADANSTPHIVGHATLNFSKTIPSSDPLIINKNYFVRKSIPFNYTGPATTPAYVLMTFTTNSTPGGGSAGDSLYFDDIQFIYNPVLTIGTIAPLTYNVTPSQGTSVSVPFTLAGTMNAGNIVTAQLSNASGSFASPVVLGTLATTTSGTITGTIPAGTPTGSGYRIRVVSSDYAIMAADNGTDIQINNISTKTLAVKVLLEGLYVGNSMMHEAMEFDVNTSDFIPKWGTGIADTITVELYDVTYGNRVAKFAGVNLHTNGLLNIPTVNASLGSSYYITIFHRNSVPITTALPLSFSGTTISYDFTYPIDQAFGVGLAPQKYLGDGFYGMYTGALDQISDPDYVIDVTDLNILEPMVNVGPFGYLDADLDGSGFVDVTDLNLLEPNVNIGPRFWNPLLFAKKKHTPKIQNK
jgi:hypothetical protein